MKIVINSCYGGFELSEEALRLYEKRGWRYGQIIKRDDPDLVDIVEQLGEKANGFGAKLKIVEIPDGINWAIEEYDGMEKISEGRKWY